jgi:hypothetical protein
VAIGRIGEDLRQQRQRQALVRRRGVDVIVDDIRMALAQRPAQPGEVIT